MKHMRYLLLTGLLMTLWVGLVLNQPVTWAQAEPIPSPLAAFKANWWQKEDRFTPLEATSTSTPPISAAAVDSAEDWWLLVHQSYRDGNWEIYRGTVANNSPQRLTNNNARDISPRISPDNTHILFVSDRDGNNELYLMQADGANQMRLTNTAYDEASPIWSPDGKRIVYVAYPKNNPDIYIMNADGTDPHPILAGATNDLYPSWSPDGNRIVFVRAVDDTYGELWIMNADGSGAYAIALGLRYASHPQWSPDGAQIAFDYDSDGNYFNDLALINSDGSGLHSEINSGVFAMYDEYAMGGWTPDGKSLLFSQIAYGWNGQNFFIDWIALTIRCVRAPGQFCADIQTGSSLDYSPDVRSLDSWPPTSKVQPLPPYTRKPAIPVSWSGNDIGPAGIAGYKIYYRTEYETDWTEWFYNVTEQSAQLYNAPNNKIYFSSQAYDRADNQETWNPNKDSDAVTTPFSWILSGQLTDVRGLPRPQRNLAIQPSALNPVKTNVRGEFNAILAEGGDYTLNTATKVTVNIDRYRVLYLHPATNLLQNGSFEDATLTNWKASASPVDLNWETPASGLKSVRLGIPCRGPCLAQITTNDAITNLQLTQAVVLADPNDDVHLLAKQNQSSLFYQHRTPTGLWEQPLILVNDSGLTGFQAVIDPLSNLWVVWLVKNSFNDETFLYYSKRLPTGVWSSPAFIVKGTQPLLAADPKGGLHILYYCSTSDCTQATVMHRYLASNGVWGNDTILDSIEPYTGNSISGFALAVTPDSVLHVVWIQTGAYGMNTLYYQKRWANGKWSVREKSDEFIDQNSFYKSQQLLADRNGNLHLYTSRNSLGYYMYKAVDANWLTPEIIDPSMNTFASRSLLLDAAGTVHFLTPIFGDQAGFYRYRRQGQIWSDLQSISQLGSYYEYTSMAAGSANTLYMVGSQSYSGPSVLYGTLHATATFTSAISQTVTIPADLPHPTLSFLYALDGGAGQSRFDVAITHNLTVTQDMTTTQTVTATQIFSDATNTPWRLGWSDLTPWQGQTVTITFAIHQVAGEPAFRVMLDDIWLGAWQTPVITTVTPEQVESGHAATLVITGENFKDIAAVRLGETLLSNVRILDEQTLQADLPASIGPGVWDMWIIKSDGDTSVHPNAIRVGKQLFMPFMAR
ncbi:MAG: IPT/TIG domain-containing protein [Caldilineaceae bacterium]